MDITAFPPVAALLAGAGQLVTAVADALAPVAGPASAALAIVLVTLVVRAAMIPLGVVQVRAEHVRRRLAPALQALQTRWKKNPQRMQTELAALYRREGTSPLAGMWTALVQLPVVSVLYTVFGHATVSGHANPLLADRLFGVPLGTSLSAILAGDAAAWPGLLVEAVVLVALAATAFLGRRRALADARAGGSEPTTLTKVLASASFVSVFFAALAPVSAGLYLVVTTTWTLVERQLLRARLDREPGALRPARA